MKILLISDIHGNMPALQAVLAAEPDADQILCLGDLVNYGPQPAECVAWAMTTLTPDWLIQGNHDRALEPERKPALFRLGFARFFAKPQWRVMKNSKVAVSRWLTK